MTYIDFRQKLKTAISEISELSNVLDYVDFENYSFPSAFVLSGDNQGQVSDSQNDLRSYFFDVFVYDEISSETQTKQSNEDLLNLLADKIMAKLDSLTVDHFASASFTRVVSGGFGFEEIPGARVRFFKASFEIRVQVSRFS